MKYEEVKTLLKEFDYNKNDLDTTIIFLDMMLFELKLLRSKDLNKKEV